MLKSTSDKVFKLYGTDYDTVDGTCVRDYINVEDLADAHIKALEYLDAGGTTNFFNLGTKEGNSVKEVFALCEKVKGAQIPLEICSRRAGDPAKLVADNAKAKNELGWIPNKTLEDSIRSAAYWERAKFH